MRFKSKAGAGYNLMMIFLGGLSLGLIIGSIYEKSAVQFGAALPFFFIEVMLVIPLRFGTWYEFEAEELHIHARGLFDRRLHYGLVTALKNVESLSPAPALSRERIDIEYFSNGDRQHIQVSPKDSEKFISLLEVRTGRKLEK